MLRYRQTILFGLLTTAFALLGSATVQADPAIQTTASGVGAFNPVTGQYFGPGTATPMGDLFYHGTLVLEEIAPGKFRFENAGRDTEEETLHEVIYTDGSTISSRFRGIVQLQPVLDGDGNPTGQFTAEWNGTWLITGGTGQFRGARGSFRVTAVNDPFFLTDPTWNFSWTWSGTVAVPNRRDDANTVVLKTDGLGTFDPANLGLGNPMQIPFPLIIGDGSGTGVYDGTPTGQASLDGVPIGMDQHFGVAQSLSPGLISPLSTVWYPGIDGPNPEDPAGRLIHIMRTDLGDIHFKKTYYFELDDVAGVIVGRADFRVAGGTEMFEGATGTVYVRVDTNLADVTGLPDSPVAPFAYDFDGFIELANGK